MTETLYFYDLETSGFSPSNQRIMQFAGQRTDLKLNPIGEPHNILIKLSEDILPDPEAILITGITPQQTVLEGVTEAEFLKIFTEEIAIPGTIFTGFNTIRFDDEFMRYLHYRNFYDPYEWQWRDNRSKWDLLDLVRMTRALRPQGINWPFDSDGKPANKLGLLTAVNKLTHDKAHDALNDVMASIALAKLIHEKQPKLFNYSLTGRSKKKVAELIMAGKPFVYTSGKYDSAYEKTAVVGLVLANSDKQSALVFDLRYDPNAYKDLTPRELADAMRWHEPGEERIKLPVKTIKYNRCPAVAPLSVLDDSSIKRLQLDIKAAEEHNKTLQALPDFASKLQQAIVLLDKQQQATMFADERTVDEQLYDGFYGDDDKKLVTKLRSSKPQDFDEFTSKFKDQRLKNLLPLYKARNFPKSLSPEERQQWEVYINNRLFVGDDKSRLAKYLARIEVLKSTDNTTDQQKYLLTELELYGQSLLPSY